MHPNHGAGGGGSSNSGSGGVNHMMLRPRIDTLQLISQSLAVAMTALEDDLRTGSGSAASTASTGAGTGTGMNELTISVGGGNSEFARHADIIPALTESERKIVFSPSTKLNRSVPAA